MLEARNRARCIVDTERDAQFDNRLDVCDAGVVEIDLRGERCFLRLQYIADRNQSVFVLQPRDSRDSTAARTSPPAYCSCALAVCAAR